MREQPLRSGHAGQARRSGHASQPRRSGERGEYGPGELPRHFLQACLLLLISGKPAYGYNLRDQLIELGVVQHDWGQLYRTLRGMERTGLVLSCWESSETGPARRTYHPTDKGLARLSEWAHGMAAARLHVDTFLARYGSPVRERRAGVSNL